MATEWEQPASAWPLGAWAMAGMLVIAIGVGVSAAVISPGLLLDAIALWPGLVPVLAVLLITAIRRGWQKRSGAIAPLLLVTWIALVGASHLSGWRALPSSAGELIGPAVDPSLATVSVSPRGRLQVQPDSGSNLYQVRFLRLGGMVGPARAEEVESDAGLSISITDGGSDRWFRYAGWQLLLNSAPVWNLNLGGDVDGDLSDLSIGSLTLSGSGKIELPAVERPVAVSVMGSFLLMIPSGTPVTVSGPANVPPTWSRSEDGYTSGAPGEGYVVSVASGGSVRIVEP